MKEEYLAAAFSFAAFTAGFENSLESVELEIPDTPDEALPATENLRQCGPLYPRDVASGSGDQLSTGGLVPACRTTRADAHYSLEDSPPCRAMSGLVVDIHHHITGSRYIHLARYRHVWDVHICFSERPSRCRADIPGSSWRLSDREPNEREANHNFGPGVLVPK